MNIKNTQTEAAIRRLAAEETKLAETAEELMEKLRPLQKAVAAERQQRGDAGSFSELMRAFDDEFYNEHGLPK